ncbi:MAG: efflux RND transporter periplasmic adaptor subunit [Candidatus Binataceae bacterium]
MIRRILRIALRLSIVSALAVGAYLFGGRYLWPPPDTSTIRVVGMIEAPEVNITSRLAGRIEELKLVEGDVVRRNQVICRIEDIDVRNQMRRAQAEVAQARAKVSETRREFKRMSQLSAEKVVSIRERDNAESAHEQARAVLIGAEANARFYKDQLADTAIRAPIDGVVVHKALEIGEWVTPGTPILTVDDLSTIWARVDVPEGQLRSIYVGKGAEVTLPGSPPLTFSGRVMAIGQEAQFATERDVRRGRQDIRTFYVKVRLLQADGQAKPGMTAEVAFSRGRDGSQLAGNSSERPN